MANSKASTSRHFAGRKNATQARAQDRIARINTSQGSGSAKVPNVYQEILSEVSDQSAQDEMTSQPPRKRRRVGGGTRAQPIHINSAPTSGDEQARPLRATDRAQIVIDSDDSDDDGDFEWEDAGSPSHAHAHAGGSDDDIDGITVDITGHIATPRSRKRKPTTSADRQLSANVHKCHVLFLLFHGYVRNMWCNDKVVETNLRTILSAKIIGLLHPKSSLVQLRQSELFIEGIKSAITLWKLKFKVTMPGMRRAQWTSEPNDIEQMRKKIIEEGEDVSRKTFVSASKSLRGSQDTGHQLFCALLRAVGVETRLVFSLQPLPLTTVSQRINTPIKERPVKPRIYATFEHDLGSSADETGSANSDSDIFKNPRRRLGQATSTMPVGNYYHAPAVAPKKRVATLDYPVFWIEVLNPAYSKWVPVDPLVTETVGKPAKLEPPGSYEGNAMSYVIAFEDDGTARDVTRRYAKAYNAKIRKTRVESLPDGQKWIKAAMKVFRRRRPADRDQIEEGELAAKEAQEGLPNNIQDYKDHPHYALERHLKRNEIIWPKRPVGKVNAGKSSSNNTEPIYRRSDVQTVQSADKWYRVGREIKSKEQPMKHVPARRRRQASVEDELEDSEQTALYAYSQTVEYIPPPVVRGKVPRNVYGNIDVYVPSMVPIGGVHIRHSLAKKAAQVAGVDYAEAVTGFQFKGRKGTAIVQGVVVAEEHGDAVRAIIEGFHDDAEKHADEVRSLECLRIWRRFILGLQIAQRIGLTDIHAADDEHMQQFRSELDDAEAEQEDIADAGGFFPDMGADVEARPTRHMFASEPSSEDDALPSSTGTLGSRRRMFADNDDEDSTMYDPTDNRSGVVAVPPSEATTIPKTATKIEGPSEKEQTPNEDVKTADGMHDHAGDFIVEESDDIEEGIEETEGQHQTPDGGGGLEASHRQGDAHEAVAEAMMDDGGGGGFMVDDDAQGSSPREADAQLDDSGHREALDEESPERNDEAAIEGEEEQEEEGDAASLLSHDPDDEDADPEWL